MGEFKIHPLLEQLRTYANKAEAQIRYFQTFDGKLIFYREWIPSGNVKKIVLVAHGMAGHGEFFVLLADRLVEKGIMVIAPDYRHHGHSDRKKEDLAKFKKILRDCHLLLGQIQSKYPQMPIFLVGESMGGAVSINFTKYFREDQSKLSGLILFAPAIRMQFPPIFWIGITLISPLMILARLLIPSKGIVKVKGNEDQGIKNPIHQRYDREDPYHLERVSMRYLIQLFKFVRKTMSQARKISIPALIFQGTEDPVISVNGAKRFVKNLASKDRKLVLIDGGFHSLFTDPEFQNKWDILIKWIEAH